MFNANNISEEVMCVTSGLLSEVWLQNYFNSGHLDTKHF